MNPILILIGSVFIVAGVLTGGKKPAQVAPEKPAKPAPVADPPESVANSGPIEHNPAVSNPPETTGNNQSE